MTVQNFQNTNVIWRGSVTKKVLKSFAKFLFQGLVINDKETSA